ncbi:MAG: hypothetical protein AB8B87_02180 [Granulosicoccus sp.]
MQTKNSKLTNVITGLVGVSLFLIFIIGLVHSVATGFAGFEGALPLILISAFVLCLVLYDLWDQAFRARNQSRRD